MDTEAGGGGLQSWGRKESGTTEQLTLTYYTAKLNERGKTIQIDNHSGRSTHLPQ